MEKITEAVKTALVSSPAFSAALERSIEVEGIENYPLALFCEAVARRLKKRLWIVCPTEQSATLMADDLGEDCITLPSTGKVIASRDEGISFSQARALMEISEKRQGLIVTHLRPFVLPVPDKAFLDNYSVMITRGVKFESEALATRLSEAGYYRSPSTSSAGEFTIRGEVMDIFPLESQAPYRIYADWDQVAKICTFDPITQQTTGEVRKLSMLLLKSDECSYCPISDYFKPDDLFCFAGNQRLVTSFKSLETEASAAYREALRAQRKIAPPEDMLFDFPAFMKSARGITFLDIRGQRKGAFDFDIDGPRSYFGSFNLLYQDIAALQRRGWKISIFSGNEIQRNRLRQMLSKFKDIEYCPRELSSGFSHPGLKLIAFCEHEIFGRRRQVVKTLQSVQSSPLDSFVDLNEGDYVVHVNYGVGKFLKIDRVSSFGRERDYIKLEYAGREFLYVPIEQANLVQRYIGSKGQAPALDHIGGVGWASKKKRARKSAEKLAGHLIGLYAKRRNTSGYPFAKDNDMQLQFEALFPFDETPDQNVCISEVKRDMESNGVMDRLICGDVGYGKTEIAFRAAFKAVLSGKQVAFLAPTTILAEQHYQNFIERIERFPVNAGLLTRMVSASEKRKVLLDVAEGRVDVLFGTHRILQKDILFRDLGLLIVDEEQRFGVKDKERIKTMRSSIDSLSLSATPIPRTLYMSLVKVRDMSLLTTPPIQRRAITTVIEEYKQPLVTEAIRKEVDRGGQVFYLHNRIGSLREVVASLSQALPDVSIDFAHGQMSPAELEDTMRVFVNGGIQVLVSTTIIENGIDIPNVNTIIIDRADRYGISQLYQLRGRVGRSDRQAYAYLLYPSGYALSELAIKRLKVISEHTGLGSGFKVAMHDMEIRGTGNLLGREQSGQVASVGLDMFIRLLDEEVKRLQSDDKEQEREVFLELDYSGFIPDSYITAPAVKFDIYRKIASVGDVQALEALSARLADKYGPLPDEVSNLLYIAQIKILCKKLRISHLKERNGKVALEFGKVATLNMTKVANLIAESGKQVVYDPRYRNVLFLKTEAVSLKDKALFIMEKLQRLI